MYFSDFFTEKSYESLIESDVRSEQPSDLPEVPFVADLAETFIVWKLL